MTWSVSLHPEVETWLRSLAQEDQEALLAIFTYLETNGPSAGRPLVDSIKTSRHRNMKELRPPSGGRTEYRILFAFDLARVAILLVAGDKSGSWKSWYTTNIPVADDRFDEHQAVLQKLLDTKHHQKTPIREKGKRR